ncbi:MAG: exonuclease domain-containing protein [Polynucleobacter sp.]|nr:exonuclease domain-containing protein [Polynucleobacter sp.]
MLSNDSVYAFVDIETTGSRANVDRITEVAILALDRDGVSEWSRLLNPETHIPRNIQILTGITPEMVVNQPTFAEIANELYVELKDKIFIAHNARFDYGFLKAEFKKVGIDFSPKVVCTVKLSRRLFPNQTRHNLDTLIQVHGLVVQDRHRALGDAKLLYQFWLQCIALFGEMRLRQEIESVLGSSSLPAHIDPELINEIPNKPGIYLFYAENKQVLYIGKSVDLRSRVMGHFHSALTNRKEMKLSVQVRDIDWIETAGEWGALLLESRLIKERLPSLNIKLRRSKDLCAWQINELDGHLQVDLVNHRDLDPGKQENLYGLFYSKREALLSLQSIAKKNQLCEVVLGLEKHQGQGSCFGYHVKQCRGACVGMEPIELHALRVKMALLKLKVTTWPYPGAIALKEGDDLHLFDHWCYLGTAANESELQELLEDGIPEFDLDIYKIIRKALKTSSPELIQDLSTYG